MKLRLSKSLRLLQRVAFLVEFTRQESLKSVEFKYWSIFLDTVVFVLRDFTHLFREKDWCLHLSAVKRAMRLFFTFDHTNYSRWTPLYFDNCLKLEENKKFMEGDFRAQQSIPASSAVPMGQALE